MDRTRTTIYEVAARTVQFLRSTAPVMLFVLLLVAGIYLWQRESKVLWYPAATAFGLALVCVSVAASAIREEKGVHSFSAQGVRLISVCFVWGACVGALFMLIAQFGRGVETRWVDYPLMAFGCGMASLVIAAWPLKK
jgi:hypothetical protein